MNDTSGGPPPLRDERRVRALRGAYRHLVTETADQARRAARQEDAELEARRAAARGAGRRHQGPQR